jgi:hypothetical protein
MNNKIFKTLTFLFSFLILAIALTSVKISAQSPTLPTTGPAADQLKVQLAPKQVGAGNYELTGAGLVPNHEVYIIDCIPTGDGQKCTSGNADYDSPAILGIGGIPPQVKFTDGQDAKRTSDNTGKVKVTIQFIVSQSIGNVFYAVQLNPPFLTNEGRGDSLQYGTFQFDPTITPIDFRADPKGRIFDSQSLEPIANVKIRILDQLNPEKLADAQPAPAITVGPDGQFNFMVKQGTYYLKLDATTHPNHTFTANPTINPNYTKAYAGPSINCYHEPGKTHQTCAKIYTPNEVINENPPNEEERDIPLDPGTNPPTRTEISTINWGHNSVGVNTRYFGKISHPLSIVKLIGTVSTGEYGSTTADKYGVWNIIVANKDVLQNEAVEARYTKVDLTQNQPTTKRPGLFSRLINLLTSFIKQDVSAQAKSPIFQPIPRYLEGYAYDSAGKIIPNAQVALILDMSPSKKVYYQTTADETGLFKVNPNNIPTFSFYLEYTKPGSTMPVKVTTSEFAQKNSKYLEESKINLLTAIKNGQALIAAGKPTAPTTDQPPQAIETTSPQTPPNVVIPESTSNTTMIAVLLLIFGIIGLIIALYFYFQKKKQTPIQ